MASAPSANSATLANWTKQVVATAEAILGQARPTAATEQRKLNTELLRACEKTLAKTIEELQELLPRVRQVRAAQSVCEAPVECHGRGRVVLSEALRVLLSTPGLILRGNDPFLELVWAQATDLERVSLGSEMGVDTVLHTVLWKTVQALKDQPRPSAQVSKWLRRLEQALPSVAVQHPAREALQYSCGQLVRAHEKAKCAQDKVVKKRAPDKVVKKRAPVTAQASAAKRPQP
jgi:hypothetical protein